MLKSLRHQRLDRYLYIARRAACCAAQLKNINLGTPYGVIFSVYLGVRTSLSPYFPFPFLTLIHSQTQSPCHDRAMAGQRSNLGPLTTTFTPAPSCSVNIYRADDPSIAWQGQECSSGNPNDATQCWPTATVSAPQPPFFGWGFYSPGLICPQGYTVACTTASNPAGAFSFQFPLLPSETAVGCCPT